MSAAWWQENYVDLMERAGQLKPMLVDFALSPRFDDELSEVIFDSFPGGFVSDEMSFAMVVDHFALQHRLRSGGTVVEAFIAAHPELTDADKDILRGWQDVVEGIFEVRGKNGDLLELINYLDELTYRARSNLGPQAFEPLESGMFILGRLVRTGDAWMISGHLATFPASERHRMLAVAAEQAMRNPAAVFRNPAKLADARHILAQQREMFTELFGADLITVPGDEVAGKVEDFFRHMARQISPDADLSEHSMLDLSGEEFFADYVAIHFVEGEGLSFYPDYNLIEDAFADPALISRRRYREALSGFLRDPEASPESLRQLAERDLTKTDALFTKLLKRKRGFSWETDGEKLLRQHKPAYFDGSLLPRTVPLSGLLADALKHTDQSVTVP
jgi:hypothetical protein